MKRLLWSILLVSGLVSGWAPAQVATPAPPADNTQPRTASPDSPRPIPRKAEEKVGLVRGVLKHLDPIHDQMVVRAFGGRDVKIAFDPRTQLMPGNATTASSKNTDWSAIPTGSVVSVDTVVESGKLFAVTVRTGGPSTAAEMNGQVLRYDVTKSRLILRDPLSPESVSFRVTADTTVVNRGQASSPQALSEGTLVHLWFTPERNTVTKVEVLAERGNSFTFQGRIVAVDLRSRVVALSNDTDQAVHELSIASLDNSTLNLLREGTDVSIQAEFDGQRYVARTVSILSRNP
jgi:hypothetical protein